MRHAERLKQLGSLATAVVTLVSAIGMVPGAARTEEPAGGGAAAKRATVGKRSYDLADHGTLILVIPEAWREEVRRPPAEFSLPPSPTIEFKPPLGDEFKLLLTVMWPEERGKKSNPEGLRATTEMARDRAKPTARETEIPLISLEGSEVRGFYFSVTDKAETLPSGEYRFMTQGFVVFGEVDIVFTLFRQEGTESLVETALEIIRGARLKPPREKPD